MYYLRARIVSTGAWSTSTGIKVDVNPTDVLVNTYDALNNNVQASHSITFGPGFSVPVGKSFTANVVITPECNDGLNWNEQIVYGQNGEISERNRSYYSAQGKLLQEQTKSMSTGEVLSTQSLYGRLGESVGKTLSAPILANDFLYRNTFSANVEGFPYSAGDFDMPTTPSNIPGEAFNPVVMGKVSGTVGWYYSSENYLEPQTPITGFPYDREYSPAGPDPMLSVSSSPGDAHKLGGGHDSRRERQLLSASELVHYLALRQYFVPVSSVSYTGTIGYKMITTDANAKMAVEFVDMEGQTLARASHDAGLYDNWSYSYYNDLGQLVASVAPNGVVIGNTAMPSYVTVYKYDQRGRQIEVTSPDEGTTQYVFRLDGKLRFSQNQLQRSASPKRFSYMNYDEVGQVIETGEYSSSTISGVSSPYVFEPHSTATPNQFSVLKILEQTGFVGTSKNAYAPRCTDYNIITHDRTPDLPAGDVDHALQEFTVGRIAKTESELGKTWYSYDEFGRVIWTKQYIDGIGYKTTDYTYDYSGNVTEVAYQKRKVDSFYHHYVFDADQRLLQAYTSRDGVSRTLRAKYVYSLHGPVKRVELGGDVQGIDYVYNIDGSLKAINHGNPAADPGGDGQLGVHENFEDDAFGEVLDYYTNDYNGAGYSAGKLDVGESYSDQYSGLVKDVRWHSPTDDHVQRAYAFQYDKVDQLKIADWGNVSAGAGTTHLFNPSATQSYRESPDLYDKNGNIQHLLRRGKDLTVAGDYLYTYKPGTNQLSGVKHQNSNLLSYTYDAIGQMVQQTEGSNSFSVGYNAHRRANALRTSAGSYIEKYMYDDRGNRAVKEIYDDQGTIAAKEYIIHDINGNVISIYRQAPSGGAVQQVEVPVYAAGRIAMFKPLVNTCFYEVGDHLGNVRAVIGVPETVEIQATFEEESRSDESLAFENYRSLENDLYDHTDDGNDYRRSQLLNGGYAGQVGLARSFKVSPGDKITASVYAKYAQVTTNETDFTTFASALVKAFGLGVTTAGEGTLASQALDTYGSLIASGYGPGDEASGPKAFVNILLFDADHNLVDAAWDQLDGEFEQESDLVKSPHDLLTQEVTVRESGFAYVFLSNEHPTGVDVYFDDFSILLKRSPIVAGADYYPFGLVMENREITTEEYRYGYQGQYAEENDKTRWNNFKLRMYDPRIARWLSPDPYREFYSPYSAMGNNPVLLTDPSGGQTGLGEPILPTVVLPEFVATWSLMSDVVVTIGWYGADMLNYATSSRIVKDMKYHWNGMTQKAASINFGALGFNPKWKGDYDPTGVTIGLAINLSTGMFPMRPSSGNSLNPSIVGSGGSPGVTLAPPVSIPLPTVLDEFGRVNAKTPIRSRVKQNARLAKIAKDTFQGNSKLSKEVNAVIEQLSNGNMNPGIGTKHLFNGIFEARTASGGRVYFRWVDGVIEILAYSNKASQDIVIEILRKLFGA
jgi:RHS repeat-associated protein